MFGAIRMQPAARVRLLGALSPDVQMDLEGLLLSLDDLYAQALGDLVTLTDIGLDQGAVGELRSELDDYGDAILEQRAALMLLDDDAAAQGWRVVSAEIHSALLSFLQRTGEQRQGTLARQQLRGLWWGLGAALVAFAAGTAVWANRRRRRQK